MTTTQYRRMCSFALRMVRLQPPRYRRDCRYYVSEFLSHLACENYGIHYRHVISWDHSETYTEEERKTRHWSASIFKSLLLCDHLSLRAEYNSDLTRKTMSAEGSWNTRLMDCVEVCLRAAIDMAAEPSAGVLGYTIGDLRRMYAPKALPKWLAEQWDPPLDARTDSTGIWL